MAYQMFRIWSAPEVDPLTSEDLRRLLMEKRRDSEWSVREIDVKSYFGKSRDNEKADRMSEANSVQRIVENKTLNGEIK